MKRKFEHLDLDLYSEKLDNGLEIYIIPKKNVNNIYATFSTKFGAVDSEFKPNGKDEIIKVPDGVAHFLEHQLFNQEDGVDPLSFFTSNGASGNANTSYYKTTYLFSGTSNFKANLTYLLDFVQSPYFTDESVEKEKGIIEQEINMYLDDPYTESFNKLNQNVFVNHPIRKNVIGSVESIKSITKEDLYTCYNTFYHPANMFLVITGNVDPIDTIEFIKENQSKKEFDKNYEKELKIYDEPDNVLKKEETLKMNVVIPKVLIGYKINMHNFDLDERLLRRYISLIANIKLSSTSLFYEKLKEDDITSDYVGYSLLTTDDHALLTIDLETYKIDEFIERLTKEMKAFNECEEDFNRKKKTLIKSVITMSDSIYSLNNLAMSNIIDTDDVNVNIYDEIKSLNYETFKEVYNKIDFDNYSIIKVEPKD